MTEVLPLSRAAEAFDARAALVALETGAPVVFPPMEMVRTRIAGRDFTFCLNMEKDPVQGRHRKGKFYERNELDRVAEYIRPGAYVVDIGTNVGNHAMYFATLMGAARVVVIEPNPVALAPLVANIVLNGLHGVIDTSCLGIGLSDKAAKGYGMTERSRNLGAARMKPGRGRIDVHKGDDLFAEEPVDLIKIDVEGMEMKVLSGLMQTIRNARPWLFVEVDDANAEAFAAWCAQERYQTVFEVRPYEANVNHFLKPMERQP